VRLAGINFKFSIPGLEEEIDFMGRFPDMKRNEKIVRNWYNDDVRPYMGRLIRGLKGKDVPSKNSEPYATYKATGYWTDRKGKTHVYNVANKVPHSLGEVGKLWGKYAHPPGQLYRRVMEQTPKISYTKDRLLFEIVFDKPFYLPIVHDGLWNLKKKYPFIDAAFVSKSKSLFEKLEREIYLEWETG
jgi:hypothetical protein